MASEVQIFKCIMCKSVDSQQIARVERMETLHMKKGKCICVKSLIFSELRGTHYTCYTYTCYIIYIFYYIDIYIFYI